MRSAWRATSSEAAAIFEQVPELDLRMEAELAANRCQVAAEQPAAFDHLAHYRDADLSRISGGHLMLVMLSTASSANTTEARPRGPNQPMNATLGIRRPDPIIETATGIIRNAVNDSSAKSSSRQPI